MPIRLVRRDVLRARHRSWYRSRRDCRFVDVTLCFLAFNQLLAFLFDVTSVSRRSSLTPSSMSQACDRGQPKVRLRQRSNFQFRVLPLHIQLKDSNSKFGRGTHASTTQSDPLLLPTRNGPCQEDGALRWEALFYRASALDRKDSIIFAPGDQHGWLLFAEILLPSGI